MKQSEIYIGGTYVLGRSAGSQGVRSTGTRVRVLEKHLPDPNAYSWKKATTSHVKVVLLSNDGSELLHAQNDWNDKEGISGTPRTRVVRASEILSLEEIERREKLAQKEREEREARQQAILDVREEIEQGLSKFFNISKADITVRVSWDTNTQEAKPVSFTISDVLMFMDTVERMQAQISPKEEA